jgi:hypothetical protein
MSGANQLRSVFEEGVLAHQPIDGGLAVGIQSFLRVSSFYMAQLFLRLEDSLRTRLLRLEFRSCDVRSSISCGGRAIVDLLDLISLEDFGTEEDRTTIKGISPATFLDGTHDQVTVLLRTDGV